MRSVLVGVVAGAILGWVAAFLYIDWSLRRAIPPGSIATRPGTWDDIDEVLGRA